MTCMPTVAKVRTAARRLAPPGGLASPGLQPSLRLDPLAADQARRAAAGQPGRAAGMWAPGHAVQGLQLLCGGSHASSAALGMSGHMPAVRPA